MKGITALFLGIFGTFAFSWTGLLLIPNYQIGHLEPQMDEEGNDAYPAPKSGMADRGRRVYAANGCVYCHTQQARPDYLASDIERKWGERRSAPRDYLFERPVLLGKMRMGPDLSNIGKRAPVEDENAPPPASVASPAAALGSAPAGTPAPSPADTKPGAPLPAPPAGVTPPAAPPTSPAPANPSAGLGNPPGAASPSPTPAAGSSSPASIAVVAASPAATLPNAPVTPTTANTAATAASSADSLTAPSGEPIPYSAAWHHRHLYSPRSVVQDSNMPGYRFLYAKRTIGSEPAADALRLTKNDTPPEGTEIVPTYDAKCLVAYLMSLDQSHALKEVKATAPAAPPAPGKGTK